MPASTIQFITRTLIYAVALFTALPFHEYAHAWTADKLGDHTARYQGRLTLNPLRHLDPLGAVLMLFAGFGWAKPVPINPYNFKKPKEGMAISALAGPVSNLLLAYLSAVLYKVAVGTSYLLSGAASTLAASVGDIFYVMMSVNVGLAVFNLIPVPPLDGSRLLNVFLPQQTYFSIMRYERYIMLALFAAIFLGVLDRPLSFISSLVYRLLDFLSGYVNLLFNMILSR